MLETLYLIFNEGYLATASSDLVREDLCAEAIRLSGLLLAMLPNEREAIGLLALMELTHARRFARVGSEGEFVPLGEQDRSLWDAAAIKRGLGLAARAGDQGPAGPYTVQAAIAAEHAWAASAAATNWPRIANLYAWLGRFDPSPVVELNGAVAIAEAEGAEHGLHLIDRIDGLDRYQPLHAARAELLSRLERREEASAAFERAIELTDNPVQLTYLRHRLAEVADG